MILEIKGLSKQEGTGLKILTPKKMIQRLPLLLSEISAGNNSESLLAHIKTINLKYLLQHGVINLNYQMDHIQHQIFKIILSIFLRNLVKMLMIPQLKYM